MFRLVGRTLKNIGSIFQNLWNLFKDLVAAFRSGDPKRIIPAVVVTALGGFIVFGTISLFASLVYFS